MPNDPTLQEYRQESTLGDDHKHWLRVKFFQQYRLFSGTTLNPESSCLLG
nr:type II toxin-antitoxin system YhaV family toxin [Oleiphilus messinensis]